MSSLLDARPTSRKPHNPGKSFFAGFKVQLRVIEAIILRETRTRFWKNRFGYFWAIAQPCIHISIWYYLRFIIRDRSGVGDMSPLVFLATGIISFFMFRNTSDYIEGAISNNKSLLSYPIVKNVDLFIARFILETATLLTVAIIVFTTIIVMNWGKPPASFFDLIPATCGLLFLGFGYGVFNSILMTISTTYEQCIAIFSRFLYFTSGIFFAVDQLPEQIKYYAYLNPITHGVQLFRVAYSHTYHSNFASIWYLLGWGLALTALGLLMERLFKKELQER